MAKRRAQAKRPPQMANKAPVIRRTKPAKKKRASGARGPGGKPKITLAHVHAVCSISDPFCPKAKNAKWPDGTSGNTLTEQFRGSVNITSDAAGYACLVLSSTVLYGYMAATSFAGTTATFPAGYTIYKGSSMVETYGDQYRIVSMGCIVRNVASANTSAGLVTLGTTGRVPVVSTTYVMGQQLYDEATVRSCQPGMEVSWVAQPRGSSAREFRATVTTNTITASDWTNLFIELAGAPASTVMLNVEWVINIEFTSKPAAAVSVMARANPPRSAVAESAVSHTHSTLGSFVSGGVAQVETAVANAAKSSLSSLLSNPLDALESIASLFL